MSTEIFLIWAVDSKIKCTAQLSRIIGFGVDQSTMIQFSQDPVICEIAELDEHDGSRLQNQSARGPFKV